MNGFRKMQDALRAEGWFVGWNLPCCQTCAWGELPYEHEEGPFKGQKVNLEKVLFNHSQDCEIFNPDEEDCSSCDGTGFIELEDDGERYTDMCDYCAGEGVLSGSYDNLDYEPDVSQSGFACMPPEIADGSTFCFDGSKNGVQNLKDVLELIEQSGCTVSWNGSGDQRIEINW